MLELALTPYDVLRLRLGTGLSSQQLHDQYIIEELEEQDMFPKYFLTMIDDGKASCAFVGPQGCRVYPHRPSACRAYPLGRAAVRARDGQLHQHFIILKEDHCKGFGEPQEQTPLEYTVDQELDKFNQFNDALASLIQHQQIREGRFIPTTEQLKLYSLALYNLDSFREKIKAGALDVGSHPETIFTDDEALLLFGIDWLKTVFFSTS